MWVSLKRRNRNLGLHGLNETIELHVQPAVRPQPEPDATARPTRAEPAPEPEPNLRDPNRVDRTRH